MWEGLGPLTHGGRGQVFGDVTGAQGPNSSKSEKTKVSPKQVSSPDRTKSAGTILEVGGILEGSLEAVLPGLVTPPLKV